jgi:hypothetical protein
MALWPVLLQARSGWANLLFRWFVGLSMDEEIWDAQCTVRTETGCWKPMSHGYFSKKVLGQARESHLMSNEHFTVDGTLIDLIAT